MDLIDFQTHQNYIENNIEKQRLENQLQLIDLSHPLQSPAFHQRHHYHPFIFDVVVPINFINRSSRGSF